MRRSTFLAFIAAGAALAGSVSAMAGGPSTGNTPLTQLGTGTYQTFQGGLYPGGLNTPPAAHLADAMSFAGQIVPRNAAGEPDPVNGRIVFISIGMSNTTHEFGVFERQEDLNTNRNARVIVLTCSHGGQTASMIASPAAMYWPLVQSKLTAAGVTSQQVQAAWVKEANAQPPNNFPLHAQQLRDDMRGVVQVLHDTFPNLRLCYLSSRIYGGYAPAGSLNPEPQAYESGFSMKWLIEDQINGDPAMNYDADNGPVEAPLLLWGPYLWADGIIPRDDGLTWLQSDMESDNVHPSPSGEQKVANLLSAFMASDPTVGPWYSSDAASAAGVHLETISANADATVNAAIPNGMFGLATTLTTLGNPAPQNSYLRFDASSVRRPLLYAKLNVRVTTNATGGGSASLVNNTGWDEPTITYNTAPPIGSLVSSIAIVSRDGAANAVATSTVNSDADGLISLALTSPAAGQCIYHSREANQAPRLVLTVINRPGDVNANGIVNIQDLLGVIGSWGNCPPPGNNSPCLADVSHNDVVNLEDLLVVIGDWG